MKVIKLFDLELNAMPRSTIVSHILRKVSEKEGGYHVSLNSFKLLEISKSEKLRKVLEKADFLTADGYSIVLAARLLNQEPIERVTGIDIFFDLLETSKQQSLKVFFLGSTDSTLKKIEEVVNSNYQVEIVGMRNGFWLENEENRVVSEIVRTQPDVCFIALPSPRKEFFIFDHLEEFKSIFLMPVGGAFDILAGVTVRAPRLLQAIGMEWLFRMLQEPLRLAPRYLRSNSYFAKQLVKSLATKYKYWNAR
jgi:N-acetylglucosaminyldiphosphoundecaprenol N-acetyl-beta-D-mannosaminyltransferase